MAYTFKPRDEAQKNEFFKNINKITERFFSGEELDLSQLATIAANGSIDISKQTVTIQDSLNVINTFVWENDNITILQLKCDLSGKIVTSELENNYLPLFENLEDSLKKEQYITLLKYCIAQNLIKEVPIKRMYLEVAKVKNRLPKSYGYILGHYEKKKKNVPMFLMHTYTDLNGDEYALYTNGSRHNVRYIPLIFKEHSYILVKQK